LISILNTWEHDYLILYANINFVILYFFYKILIAVVLPDYLYPVNAINYIFLLRLIIYKWFGIYSKFNNYYIFEPCVIIYIFLFVI
jgi:hypothetical protein